MKSDRMRQSIRLAFLALLAVTAAAALLPQVSGQSRAKKRIGVIVPFTGPLGSIGEAVRRGMGTVLRDYDVVLMDDQGRPDIAVRQAQQLILQDKVELIIGSATVAATMPVAAAAREHRVPVVSLATLSDGQRGDLARQNPTSIGFDSVPEAQLKAVRDFIRARSIRRVDAAFLGSDVALTDLLTGVMPRDGTRVESERTDLGKPEGFELFVRTVARSSAGLILATATESAGWDMVQRLSQNRNTVPVVVFAPPRFETRARLAAKLAVDVMRQEHGSAAEVFTSIIGRSPLVHRERRVVSLGWSVVTSRTPLEFERALDEGSRATTETKTCTCNASDGTCNRITCAADQKCNKDESVTPCTVSCSN